MQTFFLSPSLLPAILAEEAPEEEEPTTCRSSQTGAPAAPPDPGWSTTPPG